MSWENFKNSATGICKEACRKTGTAASKGFKFLGKKAEENPTATGAGALTLLGVAVYKTVGFFTKKSDDKPSPKKKATKKEKDDDDED